MNGIKPLLPGVCPGCGTRALVLVTEASILCEACELQEVKLG